MAITIRAANDGDDAGCGRIIASAHGVLFDRVPHARRVLEDDSPLGREGRERLIAEIDGRAVGFADIEPADGHIKYLFVGREHQGRGVGSALLAAAERTVGGRARVFCLSVNDAALRFYLRRGYRIAGGEIEEDWHGGAVVWIELHKDVCG